MSTRFLFIRMRWRKVLRDIFSNKTRLVLVVLSIAVGVFALSTVARTRAIFSRELNNNYQAVNPAAARIRLTRPFLTDLVKTFEKVKGVENVEGFRHFTARVNIGPDEWQLMDLYALPDFDDRQIDMLSHDQGASSPVKDAILLERTSLDFLHTALNDPILIEMQNGKQAMLQVTGSVNDLTALPPAFSERATGYIALETLKSLGERPQLEYLRLTVTGDKFDEKHIQAITDRVEAKAQRAGFPVRVTEIPKPGEHPLNNIIQSISLVLGVLGILALFLSVFLVANTISAILARQTKQIGVMKTIGADKKRVLRMYFGMVLLFGLFAYLVSIPLAQLSAQRLATLVAGQINFDLVYFSVPPWVWALELGASLLAPLVAATLPILSGAKITVREAISDIGSSQFGSSAIDRLLGRIRGLKSAILYSLRNIFRRKTRLALVLFALTTVSTIFITVISVRISLLESTGAIAAYWQQDLRIFLKRPQRMAKIERVLLQTPGVVHVEPQLRAAGARIYADGSEQRRNFYILGFQTPSEFIEPTLVAGRWLLPEDDNAIVVNTEFLKDEPDLSVGDDLTLDIGGRKSTWHIVGVVTAQVIGDGGLLGPLAYVNNDVLAQVTRQVGLTQRILIETEKHEPSFREAVGRDVNRDLEQAVLSVEQTQTFHTLLNGLQNTINVVVYLLIAMALLFASIGALSLTGMMSLNVLERTQEIGILRSIGATSRIVRQIVIVEGITVGVLSWLLGTILAIPLNKLLGDMLGLVLLGRALEPRLPLAGIFLWLLIILGLSVLASILPARQASRLSIREVLAYE